MIYGLYCIKDLLSDLFDVRVHTFASNRDAVFNFKKACSVPGTIMSMKPSDFTIYRVGFFNTDTGYVTQITPESLDLSLVPDISTSDVSRETSDPGKEDA